jgi:hypothetical protein
MKCEKIGNRYAIINSQVKSCCLAFTASNREKTGF